jgi:hypothetical protein
MRATTRFCSTRCTVLERQGQHAGGGGARRGHDPPRRPHHRHRSRAPASAAAGWWPRARWTDRANAPVDSQTGRYLAACAMRHPSPQRAARLTGWQAPPQRRRGGLAHGCARRRNLHNLHNVDGGMFLCSAWWRSPASAARASPRWRATCCWPTCRLRLQQRSDRSRARRAGRQAKHPAWTGCSSVDRL